MIRAPTCYHPMHLAQLLAPVICIALFTGCTVSVDNDIRDPFEAVTKAKVDLQMELVTSKKQYRDDQPISYEVVNHKDVPIYFSDYTYGLRAYVHDQQSQSWVLFPWDFGLVDPQVVAVRPGPHKALENTYVVGMMFMPPAPKVRLVVVGWLDPGNIEGSKIAAYTDIEIVR